MQKKIVVKKILKLGESIENDILSSCKNDNLKKTSIFDIAKSSLYLIKNYDEDHLLHCNMDELNNLEDSLKELNGYFQEIILKEK